MKKSKLFLGAIFALGSTVALAACNNTEAPKGDTPDNTNQDSNELKLQYAEGQYVTLKNTKDAQTIQKVMSAIDYNSETAYDFTKTIGETTTLDAKLALSVNGVSPADNTKKTYDSVAEGKIVSNVYEKVTTSGDNVNVDAYSSVKATYKATTDTMTDQGTYTTKIFRKNNATYFNIGEGTVNGVKRYITDATAAYAYQTVTTLISGLLEDYLPSNSEDGSSLDDFSYDDLEDMIPEKYLAYYTVAMEVLSQVDFATLESAVEAVVGTNPTSAMGKFGFEIKNVNENTFDIEASVSASMILDVALALVDAIPSVVYAPMPELNEIPSNWDVYVKNADGTYTITTTNPAEGVMLYKKIDVEEMIGQYVTLAKTYINAAKVALVGAKMTLTTTFSTKNCALNKVVFDASEFLTKVVKHVKTVAWDLVKDQYENYITDITVKEVVWKITYEMNYDATMPTEDTTGYEEITTETVDGLITYLSQMIQGIIGGQGGNPAPEIYY